MSAAPKRILIVDDDEDIVESMKLMLESEGYEVAAARNSDECMKSIEENRPDLILLDIMMPLLDGRTDCQKLKDYSGTAFLKIVMLTGKDDQHDRLLGFEMGADDYVTKPCTLPYIRRVIKKVLEREDD